MAEVRARQQKQISDLDEKCRQTLSQVEEKRHAQLNEIKNKCTRHINNVRRNVEQIKTSRNS